MKSFSSIPFLRVCLPFFAGILFTIFSGIAAQPGYPLLLLFMAIVVRLLKTGTNQKRMFLLTIDLFLFSFAGSITYFTNTSTKSNYYGHFIREDSSTYFTGIINELPINKNRSVKCFVEILSVKSGEHYVETGGTVLAYFKRSLVCKGLQPGATLLIKSKFQEIQPPMNPHEFNYRAYLQRKQIFHTVFVDSLSFVLTEARSKLHPLWEAGLFCKSFVLEQLKQSALSFDAYSICAALLTGYDDDIEKPVMDAFSHSGTLHVLSVSGLHTGLIYLVLNYFLNLFDPKQRFKTARFVFITLSLWSFALLAGFSAPVLRAVIMFNLLGLGKIYFRNSSRNQLNVLLVSAFILLSYNPWWITDVGFLLSYFAMFGLIYFQPIFSQYLQPSNYFLKYIWLSLTASLSATISTLPITLLLFKQFPIWFFICNLVVVPVIFAVLLLAVLVVLKLSGVATIINFLINGLISFIHLFDHKEGGFIDMIDFSTLDALFLSAFIVIFSAAISSRSYRQLRTSFLLLILWQAISIFQSFSAKNTKLLTVYQIHKQSAISVKNKTNTAFICSSGPSYDLNVKPHLISFNYSHLANSKFNYVEANGSAVLILDSSDFLPHENLDRVSTLVLTNNSRLSRKVLERVKGLRRVVSDGSNKAFNRSNTEKLCRKFGFDFYDTKIHGAFLLPLQ